MGFQPMFPIEDTGWKPVPRNSKKVFYMYGIPRRRLALLFSLLLPTVVALADNDDDDRKPPASTGGQPGDFRFGPFGLLDTRSKYNGDWYPEPFRVEDTTV